MKTYVSSLLYHYRIIFGKGSISNDKRNQLKCKSTSFVMYIEIYQQVKKTFPNELNNSDNKCW